MAGKTVKFEGKIKVGDNYSAKDLLGLLKYLSEDEGFSIKKLKSDEIKLEKNEFVHEHEGDIEIAKSNVNIEIEIEVSDSELEVEVESVNFDLVRDLTAKIADRL
ncbi:MAG: hypothetical protein CVU89_02010 [Firmicutes bacterium HGW-Firmicutes-14]|nr:MAG: hypothetical protein CVU89_02010 [Firmicutes bacterium HGW-Firmicutes-14]